MIGFRKVIDLIVKAQKPIIGHNLFMDICHIMKQFLIEGLPETLREFLAEISPRFPRYLFITAVDKHSSIYDTKYLFDTAYDFKVTPFEYTHPTVPQHPRLISLGAHAVDFRPQIFCP